MTRTPVMAAGGIVLRPEKTPLIAVVRLRKRNEWVLPKGKLDDGETPRAAAKREVLEETGHDVSVHEFLGTLVYEAGGRSKVVHYWRMQAGGEPVRELMQDVRAVDWLPLAAAIDRLSRGYERAFLANVGPIALKAAQPRRSKSKPATAAKRAPRRAPAPAVSPTSMPSPDVLVLAQHEVAIEAAPVELAPIEAAAAAPLLVDPERVLTEPALPEPACDEPVAYDATPDEEFQMVPQADETMEPAASHAAQTAQRGGLVRKMRDWLRRAA